MIEIVVGLATVSFWVVGLWCYPRCVEVMSDCCEKQFGSNDNVAIDEADASLADGADGLPAPSLLSAKYYSTGEGDSPLFSRPSPLPVAKLLKMS